MPLVDKARNAVGENIEWTNDMAGGPTRTLPKAVSGDRPGVA